MCSDLKIDVIPDAEGKGSFPTVKNISCKERNVVYVIVCVLCNKTVYVGETERERQEKGSKNMRRIYECARINRILHPCWVWIGKSNPRDKICDRDEAYRKMRKAHQCPFC